MVCFPKQELIFPEKLGSIFLKEEKVGPVELATIAFGQRFEITPLHMAKVVATIANNGKEVHPRLLKATVNSKTGERTEIPVKEGKQVISEENAKKVLSMMESVVAEGTGKNARVDGYRIGGKTGTSEDGVNTGKYVTSFVGVADIEDPEVAIIIVLYNPSGEGGHQGGAVAAPIAKQILSEVLPYLEIKKQEEKEYVEMPNVTGLTFKEAKQKLNELELDISKDINIENDAVITEQIPKTGIKIEKGTKVILYSN